MENEEGAGASAPAFFIVVDRNNVKLNAEDGGNRTICRVWRGRERLHEYDCHRLRFTDGEIVYDEKGLTPDGARVAIRCDGAPVVVE